MGRDSTFKNRQTIIITLEEEELKAFDEIRWREHKDRTKLGRQAIIEYIRNHKEGNDTFKLDKWRENPDFLPAPTITARSEIWFRFLESLSDKERLQIQVDSQRINQQCKTIKGLK